VAITSIVAALAALVLPPGYTEVAGVASILCVGAVALLAGHQWGAAIVAIADLALVAKVWPIVIPAMTNGGSAALEAQAALVAALPGLVLFATSLPRIVDAFAGDWKPKWRRFQIAGAAIGSFAWLIAPAF
jgi:hypothetical protein